MGRWAPEAGRVVLVCALAVMAGACGSNNTGTPGAGTSALDARGLRPISLPALTGADRDAQQQLRDSYNALIARAADRAAAPADLGAAFGETGKLFMAAELNDAAEPCFLNALTLTPNDTRWTYYLAHVYKRKGDLAKSAEYFERTLAMQPDTVPALWWLGTVYLEQGRPADAEARFSRVLALQPRALSAVYGLGRAALARNDYAKAVEYLERVLAMNQQAVAAHYPLGLAYRGLGKLQQAEAHLRQRSDMDIVPIDPLLNELDGVLHTTTAYQNRGMTASQSGNWQEAAVQYRKAVESAPTDVGARLSLSTALLQTGDAGGALEQAREALRLAPDNARAHYMLGTLMSAAGRDADAIDAFAASTRYEPRLAAARLGLAITLQRTGRFADALAQYDEALKIDPSHAEAQFGSAITLVRMRRYREARDRLSEGMNVHSGDQRFAHAMARLLAAAPDAGVRDGGRALTIMKALMAAEPTVDRAVTMAMALAETGQFPEAAALQREAIATAQRDGARDIAQRLAANLTLYERRQPCRTPWTDDDPIYYPTLSDDGGP